MTRVAMDVFLARLEDEFPIYPVDVEPYTREDPTIAYFVHVLEVPVEELTRVAHRAWDLAAEVFGDEPIPFHLTTIDPEQSAEYFPDALEAFRRGEGRARA